MLLMLVSGCTPSPGLKVVTYNIHHGTDAWERSTLEDMGVFLAGLDADVILLQEVDRGVPRSGNVDQVEVLKIATGMNHSYFQKTLDVDGGDYGIAILSRHPFRATSEIVPEPYLGSWYEPRAYIRASFDGFEVVNTHLHANRTYTAQEARYLADVLKTCRPVVLGGDLNSEIGTAAVNVLVASGLVIARSSSDDIDHFLTRGLAPESIDTLDVEYSDHRPKVGVFVTE